MKTAVTIVGTLILTAILWFSVLATEPQQVTPTAPQTTMTEQIITDFTSTQTEAARWRSVDDDVMGGISQGELSVTAESTGLFSGETSLENNGGFSSVRCAVDSSAFANAKALTLRVRGDGRQYQLRLKTDDSNSSISYRATFDTRPEEWITVRIPVEAFEPVFRGRVVSDAPALALGQIQQMGFLIADKKSGEFRLETDWIRVES